MFEIGRKREIIGLEQYFSVPHVFRSDSELDTNFQADSEWN